MGLKILSVFDGMSCGQIAFKNIGLDVEKYIASEIDKHAIKVSTNNFPDTEHIGDITQIKSENIGSIDVLIGGSPCQGFSRAGKGLNFDDPRSALFFEYVRLLKEVKPKYFFLENVVMKKEWQHVISDYLGIEPILINSKLVSAQNRDRLYWFGKLQNDGTYKKIQVDQPKEKNILLKDILIEDPGSKYYIDDILYNKLVFKVDQENKLLHIRNATKQGWIEGKPGDSVILDFPESKTKKGRVKTGKSGTLTTSLNMGVITDDLRIRKLTVSEYREAQTIPDWYKFDASDNQIIKMCGNGWTVEIIEHFFQYIKDDLSDIVF